MTVTACHNLWCSYCAAPWIVFRMSALPTHPTALLPWTERWLTPLLTLCKHSAGAGHLPVDHSSRRPALETKDLPFIHGADAGGFSAGDETDNRLPAVDS